MIAEINFAPEFIQTVKHAIALGMFICGIGLFLYHMNNMGAKIEKMERRKQSRRKQK